MAPGGSLFIGASFFAWGSPLSMRAGIILCAFLAAGGGAPLASVSAQADTNARASGDSADVVRPGDLIRLKIWREPDMSGDIPVDEAGVAALPRLGQLRVANLAADSLKKMLLSSYAKYLRDPAIDITVLRRITVLGAVRTPNVYHVDPTMTVADAVAMAGGPAADGRMNQVELRRRGPGTTMKRYELNRDALIADTPLRSGDELFVPQRSWLSRNAGLVLAGIGTALSIAYFVGRY